MEKIISDEEKRCSCGGEKVCYSSDVGGVEYEDEYVVYCPGCGVVHQRVGKSGGSPCADNWHTECPFCGRSGDDHAPIPFYLAGYLTRYLPLLKFKIGRTEVWIALYGDPLKEEAIVLDRPSVFSQKKIELDLPVPYNRTELGEVSENYDEVSVSFRLIKAGDKEARVEAVIREQHGYWYNTGLDDAKPAVKTTRQEIIITANGKNHLSFNTRQLS
ncbi:MAG: hypothetical protein WC619_02575 [Patescibacteria group bacterium]